MARTVGKSKPRPNEDENEGAEVEEGEDRGFESFGDTRTDHTRNSTASTSKHARPGPAQAGPSGIKKRKLDSTAPGTSRSVPTVIGEEEDESDDISSGAAKRAADTQDGMNTEQDDEIVELPSTTTGKGKVRARSASKPLPKARQPLDAPISSAYRRGAMEGEASLNGSSSALLRSPLRDSPGIKKTDTQWQATVDRLVKERDTFAQQFRDLAHTRETEAEKTLREYRLDAEKRAKSQDGIIQILTAQISRMDELAKSGRSPSLNLLTREASDVRFQQYEATARKQDDAIAELKKLLAEKDTELKAKDDEIRTVTRELAAEIELSRKNLELQQQKARQPAQAPYGSGTPQRVGQGPPASPHNGFPTSTNARIICLYEELCKVLVTKCKRKRGPNGEEPLFTCAITNEDKTLHFTLELTREIAESSSTDKPPEFTDWLWYVPISLEDNPQEFVASLGFLSSSFKFPQDQGLHFLGQLLHHMGFTVPFVKFDEEDTDEEPDDENGVLVEQNRAMEDDEIQVIERRPI